MKKFIIIGLLFSSCAGSNFAIQQDEYFKRANSKNRTVLLHTNGHRK